MLFIEKCAIRICVDKLCASGRFHLSGIQKFSYLESVNLYLQSLHNFQTFHNRPVVKEGRPPSVLKCPVFRRLFER